jgi:hypothetical protein
MISKPRKKRSYIRNTSRNKELIREVKYLRSIAKDVADRYSLRVQACLINIIRILESSDANIRTMKRPNDKTAREMLCCVRSLKVKPKKGRPKDLSRIDAVTKKLDGLMPAQP